MFSFCTFIYQQIQKYFPLLLFQFMCIAWILVSNEMSLLSRYFYLRSLLWWWSNFVTVLQITVHIFNYLITSFAGISSFIIAESCGYHKHKCTLHEISVRIVATELFDVFGY